jgi:FkbM family methyltransferase
MFSRLLQSTEDGAFVDVGANLGMFTLLVTSLERMLYSVEPTKPTLRNLRTAVSLNRFEGLVTVFGV